MSDIFTHRDKKEGKIGIGKLPIHLYNSLDTIADEYIKIIPDKNKTTHHIWYNDMPFLFERKS